MALADADRFDYYDYFLDHRNHRPGIPLDAISYHFYAKPGNGTNANNPDVRHFCEQADGFLKTVRKIERIRRRLSPSTQTVIDELGVIAPDESWKNIPVYWNAAGAMYAYLYLELSKLGIENVGESQLVGYPTQYPSVSMVNWETGKPNARFRVLEMLKKYFGTGDALVFTQVPDADIAAQAYRTAAGRQITPGQQAGRGGRRSSPARGCGRADGFGRRHDRSGSGATDHCARNPADAGPVCRGGDFHWGPRIAAYLLVAGDEDLRASPIKE